MTDLAMIRGDDEAFDLTLVDDAGDPFDLTDCELYFTVGTLFTKTVGAGITVDPDGTPAPDPTTGLARIAIVPADTEDMPDRPITYDYVVRVVLDDATIKTALRGRFMVVPVPLPVD